MANPPEVMEFPVDGGLLRALRFGAGPRIAVAAHGITASSMCWPAVAHALPSEWSLIAVDLRGRGHSNILPGPFGIRQHAADLNRVAEQLGGAPIVLVGHSMGAYASVRAVAARPELWHRLVLVDGGLPMPLPPDADPDQVLVATLGPALERLRMTFASEQAYLDFFRAHPALGPFWNGEIEAYVRYDLTGDVGSLRSRNNEQAVREDGRELVVDAEGFAEALRALRLPTTLLLATGGMFGPPPGLLPEPVVAYWRQQLPSLSVQTIDGTNHYTIILLPEPAAIVANQIVGSDRLLASHEPPLPHR